MKRNFKIRHFYPIITLIILLINFADLYCTEQSSNFMQDKTKQNDLKMKLKGVDPWFGKDKFDHFLVSAFLVNISYFYVREQVKFSHSTSLKTSISVSVGFGVSKEIWDKYYRKTLFSRKDLVADMLGVGLGLYICSQIK